MKNFERRAKINRLNKNTTNNKTSETWRVFCCCCCCFHWRIQALTHFGDCKNTEVISSSRSGSSENSRPPRGWSLSEFGLVFSRQGTTPEREEWDCNKMKTVIRQIPTIANVLFFFWGNSKLLRSRIPTHLLIPWWLVFGRNDIHNCYCLICEQTVLYMKQQLLFMLTL